MPVLRFQFNRRLSFQEGPWDDGVGHCGRNEGDGSRESEALDGWPVGHFLPRELEFQTSSCPCR